MSRSSPIRSTERLGASTSLFLLSSLLEEHPDPRLLPQHTLSARPRTARLRTARPRFPFPPVPPSPSACPLRRFCNGSSLSSERFLTVRARSMSRSAYEVGFRPCLTSSSFLPFAPAIASRSHGARPAATCALSRSNSRRSPRRPRARGRAHDEPRCPTRDGSERRARARGLGGPRSQRRGPALSLSPSLSYRAVQYFLCSLYRRAPRVSPSRRHCFEPDESLSCPTSL